ncbi:MULTISPECIES: PTS mannitol transporter subunit IICBA [Micrococcaceae]|uniref:PTS mannitol transporter subunit IICBA n=1 Tax=unclassified Kocuria TaxID=2649579 RepID=UPI001012D891|nr:MULTISPECIES: PTS mannitol transporter subunit IICBA [unclassified Kocuria]
MSTTSTASSEKKKVGARVRVQKFGTFLSSMIMPNIGAFIAWGLLTALFLWSEDPQGGQGPFANEYINAALGPMVTYLLPILIAYTGGKLIHDVRGGVVGAVATMGVILATSSPVFIGDSPGSPMFLGAMIMGPLSAWIVKKFDQFMEGRIKPGFEMLVNNFSSGIIGAGLSIASMFWLAPIMHLLMNVAGVAVQWLIDMRLLPLASILIEPAKVLFLNNAINHGILTPLGTDQALQQGKSILFLLESNPGPGLGVLLAYIIFGRGSARASAPAAALIHALGGIHEIYFPYVLMKPQLLIATIFGGMSGVFVELLFNAGLRSPAAPGSLIFLYVNAPPNAMLGVTFGWVTATIVSLVIASVILKASKQGEDDLAKATSDMERMKGKKSSVAGTLAGDQSKNTTIRSIVFACDAGMGSSAMGASVLRNKIKDAGYGNDITVVNKAINSLQDEFDLLVSHEDLADRAAAPTPSAAHVTVDNFMSSPRYDEIVELIREQREGGPNEEPAADSAGSTAAGVTSTPTDAPSQDGSDQEILGVSSIVLGGAATSRDTAIDEAGNLLVDTGKVDASYIDSMHAREGSVSTFMGNGLAIPHGTNEAKSAIHSSAMSFVRYDDGVDWNGKQARFVIGIAGAGGQHLNLLQKIAKIFSNKESVAQLEAAQTPEEILEIFGKVNA